jgi:hypothetical protein
VDILVKSAGEPGGGKVFSKIMTAALLCNREIEARQQDTSPDAQEEQDMAKTADLTLLNTVAGQLLTTENGAIALGYFSEDSPLGSVTSELTLSADQQEMLQSGREIYMTSTLFPDKAAQQIRNPEFEEQIRDTSAALSRDLAEQTSRGNVDRKSFLKFLNAIILVEEAVLSIGVTRSSEKKIIRRTATEYAIMRLLGSIQDIGIEKIDDMKVVFRVLGDACRLNTGLSDCLDNVRTYCRNASRDEDSVEVAQAVHRPFPDRLTDIGAAAQQARLYRDGEIRPKRTATPTFRSRFGPKDPDLD